MTYAFRVTCLSRLNVTELSSVTVIWAPPRFRHPHSQNPSDMGITLAIWVSVTGMPIPLGFWEWGCPKRAGCPYHCDTGKGWEVSAQGLGKE